LMTSSSGRLSVLSSCTTIERKKELALFWLSN
jgi:hypothetical protein